MDDLLEFGIDLADAPPVPRAIAKTTSLTPFTVALPDELLRIIFEIVMIDRPYEAKRLMLVSRWVRLWLLQIFYASQRIMIGKNLEKLLERPESLLRHIRSLQVSYYDTRLKQLLERTTHLERLAIRPGALCPSLTLAADSNDPVGINLYPESLQATLRELETTSIGHLVGISFTVFDLSPVAFTNVTHARLGLPYISILRQLEKRDLEVMPSLAYLAFDVSNVASRRERLEVIVDAMRIMVSSPARSQLRVLALELEPVSLGYQAIKPVYLRNGDVFGRYVYYGEWRPNPRRLWLEIALPKSKIVQMQREKVVEREVEWNARGVGRRGFWERVEEYGEVALPRPSDGGYTSDSD